MKFFLENLVLINDKNDESWLDIKISVGNIGSTAAPGRLTYID